MKKVEKLINELQEAFEANSNEENAVAMTAYMRDQYPYYGLKSPLRKSIIADAWKANKLIDNKELNFFVTECWNKEKREWQYAAMDIMGKFKKKFDTETIGLLEYLITNKSWWDTVDWLASNGVGSYFILYPDEKNNYVKKWMESGNIWLQRTCLIFQLKYREKTDFELIKSCILELKGSKEFFINKGAGWALRQYSRFSPQLVKEFVEMNQDLHSITKREANKYI